MFLILDIYNVGLLTTSSLFEYEDNCIYCGSATTH